MVSVFRRPSCRLSFLLSPRACEAELPAVDFIGNDAAMEGSSDRLVQALQELVDTLAVPTNQRGEQRLVIRGDGRTFDRGDAPECDLATRSGE